MRMSIAFLHNRFLFLASYLLLLTLFFFESTFIIFWFFIFFLVHLNKWATYHVNLLSAILLWICNVVWIINKIIYKYISSLILIISSLQLSFFLFDFAVFTLFHCFCETIFLIILYTHVNIFQVTVSVVTFWTDLILLLRQAFITFACYRIWNVHIK